jgi:glucose/arabinose dehydrogenase
MDRTLWGRVTVAACLPRLPGRVALLVVAVVPYIGTAPAQTLPTGFSATRLFVTATLSGPTALALTPDGRTLIALQGGDLRAAQNGSVVPTPALSLGTKVCSTSERGLLGVAVDPRFATNNFIFLYYTFRKFPNAANPCLTGQPTSPDNPVNRVSRFVLPPSNVIDPQTEVVLVDNIPSANGNHNGGDLHFGKDGFLYISIGDGGADYAGDSGSGGANDAARDKHKLLGKILRIDRDGGIPPTNPFQGANTGRCNVTGGTTPGNHCQETFAWGLRNPFRFSMDSNAAGVRFFINDVGQDSWEEIDEGQAGADYGWNCREGRHTNNTSGPCNPTPAGMVEPIFEYQHGFTIPGTTSPSTCDAITGGAFVPNGLWPNSDGAYLAADYTCGVIFRITKPGSTWGASDFVSNLGSNSATSLVFGPYGNAQGLYYTTYAGGGQIWVITYQAGGNAAPTAAGSAMPAVGKAPLAVAFSAAGSSDPDAGDTLTYFWDFGDGTAVATASLSTMHTYAVAGAYTATLRVRDNHFAFSAPLGFSTTALASADADANGQYDALTDGLLILRHLLGLSGAALTSGTLGPGALNTTPAAVAEFLNAAGPALDVDGDGATDALTDGLLIIRYLFGLRGPQLIQGAVGAGATRTSAAQIETYILSLLP